MAKAIPRQKTMPFRSRALNITGIYAIVATLWIYFSDQILFTVFPDATDFTRWSVVKGLAFVAITSALLLWLMWRAFSSIERSHAALRKSERHLRSSRSQLSSMVNSAMDAIVTVDDSDRITLFNRAAERLFQCTANHAIGQPVTRFLPAGLSPRGYTYHLSQAQRHDGGSFPIEAAVSSFRGEEAPMRTAIIRDVSQRLKAESELRELNESLEQMVADRTRELEAALVQARAADTLKSAFLATMSHELRTPLNSIIGFTGIVLQELAGPINEEQRKQLGMVRDSARHLLELINDVLDLSRIEAGELRVSLAPFDPREALQRVSGLVYPMAERKGLTLELRIDDSLDSMHSDRRRVEQIVLNLLNNAIKFTESGTVTLIAEREGAFRKEPDRSPVEALRLRITDTGIGIRPDDMKVLFQPFSQIDTGLARQHEGTGLGLAICRRLADRLGGVISAESQWRQGSAFSVLLPLEWHEINGS